MRQEESESESQIGNWAGDGGTPAQQSSHGMEWKAEAARPISKEMWRANRIQRIGERLSSAQELMACGIL